MEDEEQLEQLYKQRQKKINEYEEFVDKKLKADLHKVLEQRDRIYDEISQYLQLRNKIKMIQEQKLKELNTMINLGAEFYCQAKVPDTSRIFVNVGLGFHVEFTLEEATNFIVKKEEHLTKQADLLTQSAAKIKTRIKMIYHGIAELMNLPEPKKKGR